MNGHGPIPLQMPAALTYPVMVVVWEWTPGEWHLQAKTAEQSHFWFADHGGIGPKVPPGNKEAWDRLLSPKGLTRRTEWQHDGEVWIAYCDTPPEDYISERDR